MVDDNEPIEGLVRDSMRGSAPDHPGAERLVRLVTGEAGRKERAKTLDHVAKCEFCSRLLQSAIRITQETDRFTERPGYAQAHAGSEARLPITRLSVRFPWRRRAMFATAVLIGLMGATYSIISLLDRPTVLRGKTEAQVSLISPKPGASFSASEIRFTWAAVPGSAHYMVEIFGSALEMVWRSGSITETQLKLPDTALGFLQPGGRYFWRLNVVLEDGRMLTSKLAEFSVQKRSL